MMHFNSFFSPSLLIFFVLDPSRLTAAATLAVPPVTRDTRPVDPIECPGARYFPIPLDFPMFPSLIQMCARRLDHPRNLDCICADQKTLMCGASPRRDVQRMIAYCLNHCGCGQGTTRFRDPRRYTKVLDYKLNPAGMPGDRVVPNPYGTSFDNRYGTGGSIPVNVRTCDLGNGQQRSCCSKTCTAVNRDCDWFFEGDCKCYAPPAGLFYWFSGLCGSVHHLPKRDLAQQRRSFYLNATARFASTAAPALPSDLAAQLASGLLPSPCNASYVSFACADSTDGIVHEPPKNWLGALLPEGAKAPPPPVPEEFLRIHGGGEGKLQVVVE